MYQFSIFLYDILYIYKEYNFNHQNLLSWYERQSVGYLTIFMIAAFVSLFIYLFLFFIRKDIRFFISMTTFFVIEIFCMFLGYVTFMV